MKSVSPGVTINDSGLFLLPAGTDPATLTVLWQLQDENGYIWTNGLASSVNPKSVTGRLLLVANGSIFFPTDIPFGVYNNIWIVSQNSQTISTSQTTFNVVAPTINTGPAEAVELLGKDATLTAVLPTTATNVTLSLYDEMHNATPVTGYDTLPVLPSAASGIDESGEAYSIFSVSLPNSGKVLGASLIPYIAVWQYTYKAVPYVEDSQLFIATPSMLSAFKDMNNTVNKARLNIGELRSDFKPWQLASYARQGADLFNSVGPPTYFTMTKARGPFRQFWINYSEVLALRAQALFEGIRAFGFTGQGIALQVDRTQVYYGAASLAEEQADRICLPFKRAIAKRGLYGGNGSENPNTLNRGAIGALGVSLSPVSNMGWYSNYWNIRTFF